MRGRFILAILSGTLLVAGGCADEVPEEAPRPESGFVELDGSRLYYEELGHGRPVILIHGAFLDRRMWDPQFELFAKRYRVIRYDVRAHGRSGGADSTFLDHEDLYALIRHLEVETVAIVGHSMGGQIAADFAIEHPERVSALVLAAPGMSGYGTPTSEQGIHYLEEVVRARTENDFPAATEVFVRSWVEGPFRSAAEVDPALRERVRAMVAANERRWNLMEMVAALDPPAMGRLEEVRCPLLVLVGDKDMPDIVDVARMYAEGVPGARGPILLNAAHLSNLERPDEFGQAVMDFLGSVGY